jgi:hypothetical protein
MKIEPIAFMARAVNTGELSSAMSGRLGAEVLGLWPHEGR